MPPKSSAPKKSAPKKKAAPKTKAAKKKAAPKKVAVKKKPVKKSTKKSTKKSKKRSIKKPILISLLVLVIVIGAGLTYLLTNLNFIVKTAIEKYGSEATQTSVRVSQVKISLKEGSGSIQGLTVGNPKGFETKHAFSLGETGIKIDINSLTKEVKVIDDIRVLAPEIFVEVNADNQNNLQEIQKNLPKAVTSKPKSKTEKKKGEEPRLTIRRILFAEGKIFAKIVPMNKEYELKMRSFEMRNLSGTPTEISKQIISRIASKTLAEVKRKGMGEAAKQVEEEVKKQGMDQLKGLF
ncbi:hypothetical protein HQ585_15825 [candidate division KSB1 bacterium]|nr:hypothetical protein [candidate division KSB1 bacterium]